MQGAGLRIRDPSAAQERQAQPGALGDPAQEPDLRGSSSSEGEGREGLREEKRPGGGHVHITKVPVLGSSYLNWPLGKASGDPCPRPLSSPERIRAPPTGEFQIAGGRKWARPLRGPVEAGPCGIFPEPSLSS